MFYVYILFSNSINKFYVGYTSNLDLRLEQHNDALSKFSKSGIPWKIIHYFTTDNKTEAIILEKKIKKNGAKRYLERNNISFQL